MQVTPVTLRGNHVQLEPLTLDHVSTLWAVGNHPEIWRYMPFTVASEGDLGKLVQRMLGLTDAGQWLGFVLRSTASDAVVGSTSFLNIETAHRRLEIGATWITPQWQRTAINTEAKYLLLSHAFDELGCVRVEFKTDSLNTASRRALARIGAVEEGTLRNHMIMPDGRYRHSTYFGVVVEDWPSVRERLQGLLKR